MNYRRKIALKKEKEARLIRAKSFAEYKIDSTELDIHAKHRLFLSCEDASCPTMKNESGAELTYMLIDDSLNYSEAEMNRYCLDFSCEKPLPFAKRALKKIVWQPLVYGLFVYSGFCDYESEWSFGLHVKAKELKMEEGGYLRVRADVWHVKDGVDARDTCASPDETVIADIPGGTYGFQLIEENLLLDKEKTACVIVTVEGENYSGNVYFERPFLSDMEGRNLLPEFDKANLGLNRFAWLGQNLSKREWPKLEISVNGKRVFDDEAFLKVHRFSPVEVELPENCFIQGENTVSIAYKSDYPDAIPLLFDEILLLEKENTAFSLIRCPEEVTWGKSAKLLIEMSGATPELISNDFALEEVTEFAKFGLCVMAIKPKREENNLSFTLKQGDEEKTYTVKRAVRKTEDHVIAGSGDMIYVNVSDVKSVVDYIKWYVANEIGQMVTIRQVYRWGGQRFVNSKVWEIFRALCEKLDLYYVHISDGRDIPGIATNPTEKMLEGDHFLGRQLHERDGQLFYWGAHPKEVHAPLEEFFDLAARLGREYPETVEGAFRPFNIEYSEAGYSYRREVPEVADMEKAHDIAAKELANLNRDHFIRHTGPAVMFKYFYENGFTWTGTETMDGATEAPISFMRGASKAYGAEKTGVHLALQWGNYPHDTEQRYKRYLLSLYVPYMHGVTDINTEEGLWFIEARFDYFNRVSDVCARHREQSEKFNRFIKTHSRTGTFYTPIAFLQGRYDGWNGFSSPVQWGMCTMPYGDEAASWKLLKTFYPLNSIEARGCGKTGYIPEGTDKPFGIFSGTPKGCVDVVPVEKGELSDYSVLIFAGYNKAEQADLDRVQAFVENGGTLVCSWPHFSDTTLKADMDSYNLHIVKHDLVSAICQGEPEFKKDMLNGKEIILCKNTVKNKEVHLTTETGNPLVYTVSFGKGKIVVVNTLYYPGNEAVFDVYQKVVDAVSYEALSKEKVQVFCNADVEYTVYQQENGTKHYYFTAVDWYNDDERARCAKMEFGGNAYDITMQFGDLVKVVTDGLAAVYPACDTAEVIELSGDSFTAQGVGSQEFYVLKDGCAKTVSVDFEKSPVQRVSL